MIIVNLKGGLGNQMFQYALGRALSIKNNDELALDINTLNKASSIGNIPRAYGLAHFSIYARLATDAEIASLKPQPSLLVKIKNKVHNRLLGDLTVCYDSRILSQTGDIYLDGYWQSPRYFEAIRDVLLKDLQLTSPLSSTATTFLKQIQESNSVSLHVRRGDYVKNPTIAKEFGVCSLQYYKSAIATLCKHEEEPEEGRTFFIFSDDINWVIENLTESLPINAKAVMVTGANLKDTEELMLMSKCQHNIIANSSFSWWSAWLNQNPDKLVIAPTPWFDTTVYDKNLIPPSWIQLPK